MFESTPNPKRPMKTNPRDIRTGDLLFFRATGFCGRLVCWMTGSEYCHVGLAYVMDGVPHIVDFREFGYNFALLAEYERDWPGEADVYRVTGLTPKILNRTVAHMIGRNDERYGYLHILKTGLLRMLPTFATSFFVLKECERSAPHCSEAVCNAYRWASGIDLVPGVPDWHTSPADIVNAGMVKPLTPIPQDG